MEFQSTTAPKYPASAAAAQPPDLRVERHAPPAAAPAAHNTSFPPLSSFGRREFSGSSSGGPINTPLATGTDIQALKTACEISLGEYYYAARHRDKRPAGALRREVAALVKDGGGGGGFWVGLLVSLMLAVRTIFQRPASHRSTPPRDQKQRHGARVYEKRVADHRGHHSGGGGPCSCSASSRQAEVSLRVARTVARRLKRLVAKIETGDPGVIVLRRKDLDILKGWRWRVLLM